MTAKEYIEREKEKYIVTEEQAVINILQWVQDQVDDQYWELYPDHVKKFWDEVATEAIKERQRLSSTPPEDSSELPSKPDYESLLKKYMYDVYRLNNTTYTGEIDKFSTKWTQEELNDLMWIETQIREQPYTD